MTHCHPTVRSFVCLFVCWNKTRKTTLRLLCWEKSKPPGMISHGQRHKTSAYQKSCVHSEFLFPGFGAFWSWLSLSPAKFWGKACCVKYFHTMLIINTCNHPTPQSWVEWELEAELFGGISDSWYKPEFPISVRYPSPLLPSRFKYKPSQKWFL